MRTKLNGKRLFLEALFVGLLLSCSEQTEVVRYIAPLSAQQSQSVLARIRMGNAPLPPTPGAPPLAEEQTDGCQTFSRALPSNFAKGHLLVPEDWNSPEGRKIRVFYYGSTRAQTGNRNLPPVVFYNGGPGSDSHGSYQSLGSLERVRQMPFIYIDQRGTGCSDPFPSTPTTETAERLTHYGSRSIVKDSEAVRRHLFGESTRWRTFGQSYGGLVVHRYVTVAPEGLISAHSHGFSIMSDSVDWLAERMLSQKRVLRDYLRDYPGDDERMEQIRAKIDTQRCFDNGTARICGSSIVDAFTILLGFRTSWNSLHRLIDALAGESQGTSDRVLTWFVRTYVFGVYANNAFAAGVISKAEISSGLSDAESCRQATRRLETRQETPATWPINECRLLSHLRLPTLDPLLDALSHTDPLSLVELRDSLTRHSRIPFFLYSGAKDVFVPIATFAEETRALGSRITYREFPSSGHEGFQSEPEVWTDLIGH